MRAHSSAGIDGRLDLVARGLSVADGDKNAAAGHAPNEISRAVIFRRNGRQLDSAVGSLLQPLKLIPIRRPDMLLGVRAARPIVGTDERAFEMNAGNARRHFGQLADCL